MKNLKNNQKNSILFVKSGENLSGIYSATLRQLGSDNDVVVPASIEEEDCFTATVDVVLENNQLPNATYLMKVLNSSNDVVFTTTVVVDDNDDSVSAFLVFDNDNDYTVKPIVNENAPVIKEEYKLFVEIGVPFSFQMTASNNPTSWSSWRGVDGVSISETGLISGIVTDDSLGVIGVEAINEYGKGSFLMYIQGADNNPNIFLPPVIGYSDVEPNEKSFVITLDNPSYNGTRTEVDIAKDGVVYRTLILASRDDNILSTLQQLVYGTFDWKVRYKNDNNEYSIFSNIITVTV